MTTLEGQDALHHRRQPRHRPRHRARAARDGANIAIAAKTAEPHPKLEGTIYTAAKEIEAAGGKALPIVCDIRFEDQVQAAVAKTVETFGGLDICVNNASAISLTPSTATDMKRYDLMHGINARGTFLVSKTCIPHLKKAANPHILMLSPPLDMSVKWFAPHVAYSMAKFNMSIIALGLSGELKPDGIAVNTLWPRTTIATAAVQNLLGGDALMRRSRTPEIMGDAAHVILTQDAKTFTGRFCIDDTLLYEHGVRDFEKYRVDPEPGAGARLLRAGLHPATARRHRGHAAESGSLIAPGCLEGRAGGRWASAHSGLDIMPMSQFWEISDRLGRPKMLLPSCRNSFPGANLAADASDRVQLRGTYDGQHDFACREAARRFRRIRRRQPAHAPLPAGCRGRRRGGPGRGCAGIRPVSADPTDTASAPESCRPQTQRHNGPRELGAESLRQVGQGRRRQHSRRPAGRPAQVAARTGRRLVQPRRLGCGIKPPRAVLYRARSVPDSAPSDSQGRLARRHGN